MAPQSQQTLEKTSPTVSDDSPPEPQQPSSSGTPTPLPALTPLAIRVLFASGSRPAEQPTRPRSYFPEVKPGSAHKVQVPGTMAQDELRGVKSTNHLLSNCLSSEEGRSRPSLPKAKPELTQVEQNVRQSIARFTSLAVTHDTSIGVKQYFKLGKRKRRPCLPPIEQRKVGSIHPPRPPTPDSESESESDVETTARQSARPTPTVLQSVQRQIAELSAGGSGSSQTASNHQRGRQGHERITEMKKCEKSRRH
jgi:hypothetical protein